MCGRYYLTADGDDIEALFGVAPDVSPPPRYNIGPAQPVLIIRQNLLTYEPDRQAVLVGWGFVPDWAKDGTVGGAGPFINARSETLHEKASFRNAWRRRRCLIPANGFYEWDRSGETKQPYRADIGGALFALAGIWECWLGPDGTEMETCCTITRPAGRAMRKVHHREPVVVPPEAYHDWLHADERDLKHYARWLDAAPPAWRVVPVGRDVGNVRNDYPGLLEEVAVEKTPQQGQLF